MHASKIHGSLKNMILRQTHCQIGAQNARSALAKGIETKVHCARVPQKLRGASLRIYGSRDHHHSAGGVIGVKALVRLRLRWHSCQARHWCHCHKTNNNNPKTKFLPQGTKFRGHSRLHNEAEIHKNKKESQRPPPPTKKKKKKKHNVTTSFPGTSSRNSPQLTFDSTGKSTKKKTQQQTNLPEPRREKHKSTEAPRKRKRNGAKRDSRW